MTVRQSSIFSGKALEILRVNRIIKLIVHPFCQTNETKSLLNIMQKKTTTNNNVALIFQLKVKLNIHACIAIVNCGVNSHTGILIVNP